MATKNTTSQKIFKATALSCTIIVLLFAGLALYLNQVAGGEVLANMLVPGIIGVIIAVGLVLYVSKRLVQTIDTPITRLKTQLKKIRDGDLEARIGLKTGDDFQEIGQSIDNVIGNRFASLINIEDENETLNDSIVTLLETVAQLAQKNLTIRAKVSEDMTGPIADALNMMATETAKVLNRVMAISEEVAETSNLVKTQADNVLLLADEERQEVENAAVELKTASETMANIAKLAVESNTAAEEAIRTTLNAMSTVTDTVESINKIRDSIRETEKRIKRLGERSQEISTAVNLINNISERTHILALNASMHAASAGEAGRGFAVVADEVQRLAENAREATTQIGTLVSNIQAETASTVTTMNELISQVVGGSQLAQQAGKEMEATQSTTANLVSMVQEISKGASTQAKTSHQLRLRADNIRESVRKTGSHLREQTTHTDELVEQAMALVASVGVFKLEEGESELDVTL